MSIGAVFTGLALLILAIPIVAGPVINRRRERFSLVDDPGEPEAQENYHETLLTLRDLDFDHQLGIVAEDDYTVLRAQLLATAAQVREAAGADLEDRIEMAVRDRRPPRSPERTTAVTSLACYQCDAEMGPGDRFCVSCGSAAAPFCPQCNLQAGPGDKFCAGCGAILTARVAA